MEESPQEQEGVGLLDVAVGTVVMVIVIEVMLLFEFKQKGPREELGPF